MNTSILRRLDEGSLGVVASLCEPTDLLELSCTEKNACQKMLQIWVRRLEEQSLFFVATLSADRKIVNLKPFTQMVSINFHCHEAKPADYHPCPREFYFQTQVSYNKSVINRAMKFWLSRIRVNCTNELTEKQLLAKHVKNGYVQSLVQGRLPASPLDIKHGIFIEKLMRTIAQKQYELFALLEIVRASPLTHEGRKEIVAYFNKTTNSDSDEAGINEKSFNKYKTSYPAVTNFLLTYAARCGNEVAVRELLETTRNKEPVFVPQSYPSDPHMPPFLSAEKNNCTFTYVDPKLVIHSLIGSALGYAAFYGHASVVKLLIDYKANVNYSFGHPVNHHNFKEYREAAALICAVAERHLPVVQALLDAKADPNLNTNKDPNSLVTTPLGLATNAGDEQLVQLLLQAKADPNAPSKNNDVFASPQPLLNALSKKNSCIAKLLMAYKADINSKSANGMDALTFAVGIGDVSLIENLLANKADVNSVQRANISSCAYKSDRITTEVPTPLMTAVEMNNLAAIKVLIAAKADPDAEATIIQAIAKLTNDLFSSTFGRRRQSDTGATVSLLLGLGAQPDVRSHYMERTALICAVAKRDFSSVCALLAAKANCNLVDADGQTPLIHAVNVASKGKVGHMRVIVEELIRNGAKDIPDKKGKTALSIALSKRIKDGELDKMVELLTEAADSNKKRPGKVKRPKAAQTKEKSGVKVKKAKTDSVQKGGMGEKDNDSDMENFEPRSNL